MQTRSKATVATILEAAAQVLIRDGHGKTTTNGIAERAGISVGTLYHYFPNKTAIVEALTTDFVTNIASVVLLWRQQAIEKAAQSGVHSMATVEQRARFLVGATIDLLREQAPLARVLFDDVPASNRAKVLHGLEQRFFEALPDIGDPVLEAFRHRDPKKYAATLSLWLTMAASAIFRIALDKPKSEEDDLYVDILVRTFICLIE